MAAVPPLALQDQTSRYYHNVRKLQVTGIFFGLTLKKKVRAKWRLDDASTEESARLATILKKRSTR
eukprot:scaffold14035_cov172-Amphora_coffeaeformis.AAC.9